MQRVILAVSAFRGLQSAGRTRRDPGTVRES
jgi:hypothetical protein